MILFAGFLIFRHSYIITVTALMREAQRFGRANFQIRILMDFDAVTDGLIEINDTTGPNRRILAPVLQVAYF